MSEAQTAAVAAQVGTMTEALGETPPITDQLIFQARRDHLAALAYGAADAGVELILAYHRGEALSADGPIVQAFVTTLLYLDRGWTAFVRDTEIDADVIVTDALTFWGGTMVAVYVQSSLEQVRQAHRRAVRELYPDA